MMKFQFYAVIEFLTNYLLKAYSLWANRPVALPDVKPAHFLRPSFTFCKTVVYIELNGKLTFFRLDVNPPKCRNLEVMKSRNANIRDT